MKPNLYVLAHMDRESLRQISEADFQQAVKGWARDRDWLVYSVVRSAYKTASGKWKGMADPGWPDVVFSRRNDLFVAELKSETGSPSRLQRVWIAAFMAAGKDAYIWRPRDAAQIVERLEAR